MKKYKENLASTDKAPYPKHRIPSGSYKKYVEEAIRECMPKHEPFEVDDNFKTIANYFYGTEDFDQYKSVLNTPSLEKGLYIYGDVGTGKTLTMKIMQTVARKLMLYHGNSSMWFSSRIAPYFPEQYMEAANDKRGEHTFRLGAYYKGKLYIDDVGMERPAFTDFDTIGELLFYRHREEQKTFITTNLTPSQFGEKYGMRMGDRLPESYNIIHFKGESKRKE